MSFSKISALAGLVALASKASAHGHATGIVADGVYYVGYNANYQYMATQPVVVGWSAPETLDNGFVAPDAFANADIICHKGATNAQTSATVKAGGTVEIQWTAWPESHHGPVIDYLADCGGDCKTVDKTKLEFFKIDGVGLLDDTTVPGNWASDQLIANNNSWTVTIPPTIAPGNYVLRHEIIALHAAGSVNGAQNYPQCFNLEVTGSGTDSPSGTLGTALYTETEPGIEVNIYTSIATYTVPGPALYTGAVSASQGVVTATASASQVSATASASQTSSAAPVITSAPASSVIPTSAPFSNSTIAAPVSSKKTKSACKAKTSSSSVVSAAAQATPATGAQVQTTSAASVTIPTSVPTEASQTVSETSAASSPSSTSSSSGSSSSGSSTSAPAGTTLGDLLAWISSFYTKHAGKSYNEATVARRHARDLAARQFDGLSPSFDATATPAAQPSGVAQPSGFRHPHHHHPSGSGFAFPTGAGFGGARPTGTGAFGDERPSFTGGAGAAFPTGGQAAFFKHAGF